MDLRTDALLQPAVAAAMSTPPVPATTSPAPNTAPITAPITAWAPPAAGTIDLRWPAPAEAPAPSLFVVPASSAADDWAADPMVDTVPHPVVKLFPLAGLEPDLAGGSIDDRVFAAFDAERRHLDAAALANGRHAATTPTDAAAPRNAAYRSKHSA
jgi:hypothetical protein